MTWCASSPVRPLPDWNPARWDRMGTLGDAVTAMAESFFATLQAQLLDRSTWFTRAEPRRAVVHYIKGFYNPRYSGLGYLSPVQYESAVALPLTDTAA